MTIASGQDGRQGRTAGRFVGRTGGRLRLHRLHRLCGDVMAAGVCNLAATRVTVGRVHWRSPRYTYAPRGPLAQLGERRLCTAEVRSGHSRARPHRQNRRFVLSVSSVSSVAAAVRRPATAGSGVERHAGVHRAHSTGQPFFARQTCSPRRSSPAGFGQSGMNCARVR